MISSASLSAALVGVAALSNVVRAQDCTPLLDVAAAEGRTTFVAVAESLVDNPAADDIVAAATATEPLDQPLTIFIPTNAELSAADESVGDDLDALVYVLATHIVPKTITGDEITGGDVDSATALNGETLNFTDKDESDPDDFPTVAVGDGTNVVISDFDIPTCAGTVHLINKVLIPDAEPADMPSMAPEMMMDVPAPAPETEAPAPAPEMDDAPAPAPEMDDAPTPVPEMEDAMEEVMPVVEDAAPAPAPSMDRDLVLPPPAGECNSVLDALQLNEDTAQLAAVAAQLLPPETRAFLANPENNLTVLAPPNEVVTCLAGALQAGIVSELEVIDVLSLHVIPDFLEAADVVEADGMELETSNINGAPLMVMVDGDMVMFAASDDSAVTVVETDLDGCGSAQIIHRIDGVLIPPTLNVTVADLNCAAPPPTVGPGPMPAPEPGSPAEGIAGFLTAAVAATLGLLAL